MAVLGLSAAAQAAGITRQHLYRLVSKGKVSATLRQDGTKGIDTSELLRVFGSIDAPKATGDSQRDSHMRQQATSPETAAKVTLLEVELRAARDALRVAEERLRDSQERETKLLDLLTTQTRLLEHHQQKAAPAAAAPAPAGRPKRIRAAKKPETRKPAAPARKVRAKSGGPTAKPRKPAKKPTKAAQPAATRKTAKGSTAKKKTAGKATARKAPGASKKRSSKPAGRSARRTAP